MLTDRSRIARSLCSSLAIATALVVGASTTHAQSFQGNGTFASGTGGITTSTGTTTVTLTSSDAVINWTTFDTVIGGGPINFQPASTTATFQSTADFSVLNRILPTDPSRAVQFNGNVVAQIQGTTTTPGGSVYFYSPGGVIVGSSAVFNVGNLGLTSISPEVVGGVFEQTGAGGEFVRFNGPVTPGSAVLVQSGAQITSSSANVNGSYVALVAPVIDQRGTINVSTAAALVSADAATITFSPTGLIDIQVTLGTSGTGTTLFNNGTITGPAFSGVGPSHRIYAVAVPKNTAITLAIGQGSQLGFNIAGAADVAGNAVVLSAGRDIFGGNITTNSSTGGGTGAANLSIEGTNLTSALTGSATGTAFLFSQLGNDVTAASNVSLRGIQAKLSADGAGSTTTVTGNVLLDSDANGAAGTNATGGTSEIFAVNSGAVSVGGAVDLRAGATAGAGIGVGSTGGIGTGGTAIVQALTGGTVSITGAALLRSLGTGGAAFTGGGNGGTGFGGRSQVFASGAGSNVTLGGTLGALALGSGGTGFNGAGGTGTGGQALVNAQTVAGASISISGAATLNAYGIGGNANGGNAGTGIGGSATAAASASNGISFVGSLDLFAGGQGGNSTGGNAGSATGGAARITLFSGGTMSVGGNAQVHGLALAGMGNPNSALATGSIAAVSVQQNSVLNVTGSLLVVSSGLGDRSFLGVPSKGAGIGGTTTVDAFTNGAINVGGVLRARADATATSGLNSTAGSATVAANSGGDITASQLNVSADGVGGTDTGTGAGFGRGGTASLFANGAGSTVTITNGNSIGSPALGELDFLSAEGFGGATNGGGSGVGGAGFGGTVNWGATTGANISGPTNGGTVGVVRVFARATGGNTNGSTATAGGNATAGTINLFADAATISSFQMLPSAFAQGGNVNGAPTTAINGGNTIGGTRNITVNNGGTLTTSLNGGTAGGQGGNGSATGRGGDASGGAANLTVDNGSTLNIPGNISVFTTNSPGAGFNSGNATGGNAFARIANGSTVNQTGPATNSFFVAADVVPPSVIGPTTAGSGGTLTAGTANLVVENATLNAQTLAVSARADSNLASYARGANSTGGTATLQLIGATLNVASINIEAVGSGGSLGVGVTGVAGNGTGGLARLIATGGTSTVTAAQFIDVDGSGLGGDVDGGPGTTTGNAIGGRGLLLVNGGASLTLTAPSVSVEAEGEGGEDLSVRAAFGGDGTGGQAEVFVNGGNLTINGNLNLEADNDGGEGLAGGDGLFRADGLPNTLIHAQNGGITVTGGTTLYSRGFADNGAIANGGLIVVDAQSNLSGSGTITLNGLLADVSAAGGDGIAAPAPTAPGGRGGDAFGGAIQIFGTAGNGNLVVNGSSTLTASALGGAGGTGHPGAAGTSGGAGGNGTGGDILFGTRSALDTGALNTGSARFGAVSAIADGAGGVGGAGGSGTTTGPGGAGGDGFGGAAGILSRGSPVTITGTVDLSGDALGGNGGTGSTQGAGGDAMAGNLGDATDGNLSGIGIAVTSRFNQPTQLGSLAGGTVTGSAIATAGAGSTPGAATVGDSPISVFFDGGTGNLGTIDFIAGGRPLAGTFPSLLTLNNATLNVTNTLRLQTPGAFTLSLGSSTLNVGTLTLSAGNFVLPAARPATLGTINVTGVLSISSALDFLAYANFNVPGDFALTVPGSIFTGGIQASEAIDLDAGGTITTGQLTAGDTVEANAGGALNVAGASAGLVNPSTSTAAGFNVGLRSLTSVVVGNVAAKANFGVSSPGSIAVGNVSVGQGFLALPGTSLTTGSITTSLLPNSRVYIANFSMEALGGQVAGAFNPAPILAAAPVATGGPITINGPVSTVTIQANTLQSLTALGSIQTPGATVLIAGTTLNAANITVGDRALIAAGGNISLGNVNAGITIPSSGVRKIAIGSSTGTVTTGNLASVFDLGIQAGGGISTGTLLGRQILLLAGTNVSTGAISAVVGTQPVGKVYIGNFSMANQTSNVFQSFTSPTTGAPLPIFNLQPVRVGGAITIGGAVAAGQLFAAAAQGIGLQAVTTPAATTQPDSGGVIDLDSGGTVTVAGRLAAGHRIDIVSRDIDITQTGSLDALGITGEILLASTNPNGMFVGDGLTAGSGYALSNDEFSRVRAGEIDIVGTDITNLATDVTIGNLTINATQLYGAGGIALFASGNRDTQTPSGILRIAGAVTANGFAPTNEIHLLSGTVELEAEKGSLKVNAGSDTQSSSSSSSSLGGLISVEADHIHIASDAILTKLRADPLYSGHIAELNAPATVQRTDGVLNAAALDLAGTQTIYIQNTGTAISPAGFVTTLGNTDVGPHDKVAVGSVNLVINGQLQTPTGIVTGKTAFDLVIAMAKADAIAHGETFAADIEPASTFNGCVIVTGVCAFGGNTQMAPPASEISVIISPVLATSPPPPAVEEAGPGDSSASASDSEAAAEDAESSDDEKKDEGDGDEAASPIAPPTPLISTRALDGDVNVVEPVSGAGNPALFGSAVDETTVQGGKP